MRKAVLLISFLLSFQIWAQNNTTTKADQLQEYHQATTYLKNAQLNQAMNRFYYSNWLNPETEIATLCLKKADSLKIILRKDLIASLSGNWKMFDDRPSWGIRDDSIVGNMITINPSEIQFFELTKGAKAWKLTQSEKIIHTDTLARELGYSDLVFANQDIWYYYLDDKTGYLNTTFTGKKTDIGRTEIICGTVTKTYFKLQ